MFGSATVVVDTPVPPLFVGNAKPQGLGAPPPAPVVPGTEEIVIARNKPTATKVAEPEWAARPDGPSNQFEAADQGRINRGEPFLAGLNGPFGVYRPDDFVGFTSTTGVVEGSEKQKEFKPLPLVDFRTGATVGTFAPNCPVWMNGRLSPDGQYVVGPDTVRNSPATVANGDLFIWKRGEDKPANKFQLNGILLWTEFVSNDTIATVTFDQKVEHVENRAFVTSEQKLAMTLWNVTTGQKTGEIPLEADDVAHRRNENIPSQAFLADGKKLLTEAAEEDELLGAATVKDKSRPKLFYVPKESLGAVSPGGNTVVLGGRTGVTFVSIKDRKVIGRRAVAPLRTRNDYQGFGFSRDGATVHAVVNLKYRNHEQFMNSGDNPKLRSWNVTDGKPLPEAPGLVDLRTSRLMPGPTPTTLTFGPYVLDIASGLSVATLPFEVVRWTGPGRALLHGPLRGAAPDVGAAIDKQHGFKYDRESFASWVRPFDEAALISIGGPEYLAHAARPAVVPADRAGVATKPAVAPAAWAVPPADAPPPAPGTIVEWPHAWSQATAAVIEYRTFVSKSYGTGRLEVLWKKIDLATGKEIGASLPLWPWARRGATRHLEGTKTVAALAPAGDRLALVDPASDSRVDIWDADGKRLAGFEPYGPNGTVRWTGWAKEKFLTLGGGKLTAWEMPACRAIHEIDGGYTAVQLAPGGAWAAAVAPAHVDFIDTATGNVLGRCKAAKGIDEWTTTLLAPDGRSLLRIRSEAVPGETKPKGVAHVWDLTNGKEGELLEIGPVPEGAAWAGNRRFLGIASACSLVDLDAGGTIWNYGFPDNLGAMTGQTRMVKPSVEMLATDPSGGIWISMPAESGKGNASSSREWKRVTVPNPSSPDEKPLLGERTFAFRRGSPVRVEVTLDIADRSRKLAERVAGLLQNEGFTIAPNGWHLKATHEGKDGNFKFDVGGVTIPVLEIHWELIAPDGAKVWSATTKHGWAGGTRSKYYRGTKDAPAHGMNAKMTSYDFGLRSPRSAMLEEILEGDDVLEPKVLIAGLPRLILKSGGDYIALPKSSPFAVAKP